MRVKVNDLIGIGPGYNTHGCRDYAILRYAGRGKARVVEASSCTSCWQVGHDSDHLFAKVGEVIDITQPNQFGISIGLLTLNESNPTSTWASEVKWGTREACD